MMSAVVRGRAEAKEDPSVIWRWLRHCGAALLTSLVSLLVQSPKGEHGGESRHAPSALWDGSAVLLLSSFASAPSCLHEPVDRPAEGGAASSLWRLCAVCLPSRCRLFWSKTAVLLVKTGCPTQVCSSVCTLQYLKACPEVMCF